MRIVSQASRNGDAFGTSQHPAPMCYRLDTAIPPIDMRNCPRRSKATRRDKSKRWVSQRRMLNKDTAQTKAAWPCRHIRPLPSVAQHRLRSEQSLPHPRRRVGIIVVAPQESQGGQRKKCWFDLHRWKCPLSKRRNKGYVGSLLLRCGAQETAENRKRISRRRQSIAGKPWSYIEDRHVRRCVAAYVASHRRRRLS